MCLGPTSKVRMSIAVITGFFFSLVLMELWDLVKCKSNFDILDIFKFEEGKKDQVVSPLGGSFFEFFIGNIKSKY